MWMTIQEYAEKSGIKLRAAKTRVKYPEKWGIVVKRKKLNEGPGRKTVFIAEKSAVLEKSVVIEKSAAIETIEKSAAIEKSAVIEKSAARENSAVLEKSAVEKSPPQSETPIDLMSHFKALKKKNVPIEEIFEKLLHKKSLNRTPQASRQIKRYYTKQFNALGRKEVPKGLLAQEGRKNSGKMAKQLPAKIEARFVEMVKESSDPDNGAAFLSRSYRKVCHFHKVLEHEFDCKINIRRLYKAKKANGLLKYFDRPDFDEDDVQKNNHRFFKSEEVLALVQMDGSWCKSFKIKKGEGYKQPIVITLFDTGSRCVLAKEFYFSESSENSIDVLIRWLKQPLPKQKIKFRPDNAGGFLNTNRAFQEINYKYSEKGGFVFDFNPAHVYSPKEKVHIERQYGEFRTFEAWIQERIKDRYAKMEAGYVDVNGKKEHRRLKCYDITLEEIQDRKIIDEYIASYNNRLHRFTENGVQKQWIPNERMASYLEGKELIHIEADLLDKLVQYGMQKDDGKVRKEGHITYKKREWVVTSGDFSRVKSTPVKFSLSGDRLLIFSPEKGGIKIGEARMKTAPAAKDIEAAHKRSEKRVAEIHKKIEGSNVNYEKVLARFKEFGMIVPEASLERLFQDGLTLDITNALLEAHETKYRNRMTGRWANMVFNLFISDFRSYQKNGSVPVIKTPAPEACEGYEIQAAVNQ